MAYMKPTSNQVALARFLIDEDNDSDSVLNDKVFLEDRQVYSELVDIAAGREYIGEYRNEINHVIKKLDEEHGGYIKDNWNNEETDE